MFIRDILNARPARKNRTDQQKPQKHPIPHIDSPLLFIFRPFRIGRPFFPFSGTPRVAVFSAAAAIARAPRTAAAAAPVPDHIRQRRGQAKPHRGQRQNTLKIHANPLSIYYTRKKAVFNADGKNNPSDENPADQRDEEAYRPRHEALPDDQPRGPAPSQLPLDRRHRRHARRV